MFARLVLSDIFIHGIGGAKYDQLTDAIVRRFFGVEPWEYLVATATLKLPLPRHSIEEADMARIDQMLRELRYHPELYVDATMRRRASWWRKSGNGSPQQVLPHERRTHHEPRSDRDEQQINRACRRIAAGSSQRRLIDERNELRCTLAQASDLEFARVCVLSVPRGDFTDTATGSFAQEP